MVGEYIALDQDAESLEVVHREHPGFNIVCAGVKSLLTRKTAWKGLDFVYAAGLYDYLPAPVACRLTSRLFDMLRAGGQLLVANFHRESPDAGAMETWMDWWLI